MCFCLTPGYYWLVCLLSSFFPWTGSTSSFPRRYQRWRLKDSSPIFQCSFYDERNNLIVAGGGGGEKEEREEEEEEYTNEKRSKKKKKRMLTWLDYRKLWHGSCIWYLINNVLSLYFCKDDNNCLWSVVKNVLFYKYASP